MKRQFDAACRQYVVKTPSSLENLWTNNLSWPSQGVTYDAATQTYEIPVGATSVDLNLYTLPEPIPTGTTISVSAFFDSGYYSASRTALYIGGLNGQNSWQAYSGGAQNRDLTGKSYLKTFTTTAPITRFAIVMGDYSTVVSEPIRFRVMLVIGDTPANEFKPFGFPQNAWTDGLKSGLPSVKMLGKTEQQTYTGKNLLDVVNAARIFGSTYDSKFPSKYENGVLWNGGKSGTSAGASIVFPTIPGNYTIAFRIVSTYENQNVRVIAAEGYSAEMIVQNQKILAWLGSKAVEDDVVTSTVTVPEGYNYLGFSMQASEIHSFGITDVMICSAESDSSVYEPYTGGISSPHPLYPQEVKANNATVKSCGKNLFNTARVPTNVRIKTVTRDYIVIAPSSPYAGNGYTGTKTTLRELAPDLVIGKQYVLSFISESSIQSIYLSAWGATWKNGECVTVTENMLSSEVVFYAMSYANGDPETDCRISNIQIEEGEVATKYEPYLASCEATAPNLYAVEGYRDEWR